MVKVKSESEAKKNYEDSTALVPGRYAAGVNTATWQGPAQAGQGLYEEQMRRAEILQRRSTGIGKVSDAQWKSAAITKGQNVIGSRMKAASQDQVDGFRPYRSALEGLTLPAKTADPMANLLNRAGAVVDVMVKTKAAQG